MNNFQTEEMGSVLVAASKRFDRPSFPDQTIDSYHECTSQLWYAHLCNLKVDFLAIRLECKVDLI